MHNVDESWQQEEVRNKTYSILREVEDEVDGSQDHWDQVNGEHDGSTKGKQREVSGLIEIIPSLGIGIVLLYWGIEACSV